MSGVQPMYKPITIVTGNVAGSDNLRPLAEECDRSHPDVVALNELDRGSVRAMKAIPGYRRPQTAPVKGERFIGSMVRRGVQILNWWILVMNLWWRYKSRRKAPREFIVERVEVDGQRWRVITVHFPTAGPNGGNRKAWMEAWDRLVRTVRSADLPTVVIGDFNASFEEIKHLAGRAGLEAHDGTKVDHALTFNCEFVNRVPLDQPKGWHGFIRWRFRVKNS